MSVCLINIALATTCTQKWKVVGSALCTIFLEGNAFSNTWRLQASQVWLCADTMACVSTSFTRHRHDTEEVSPSLIYLAALSHIKQRLFIDWQQLEVQQSHAAYNVSNKPCVSLLLDINVGDWLDIFRLCQKKTCILKCVLYYIHFGFSYISLWLCAFFYFPNMYRTPAQCLLQREWLICWVGFPPRRWAPSPSLSSSSSVSLSSAFVPDVKGEGNVMIKSGIIFEVLRPAKNKYLTICAHLCCHSRELKIIKDITPNVWVMVIKLPPSIKQVYSCLESQYRAE